MWLHLKKKKEKIEKIEKKIEKWNLFFFFFSLNKYSSMKNFVISIYGNTIFKQKDKCCLQK